MTDKPEQWAVELAEAVELALDGMDPTLAALTIQRAFEDQTRELRDRIAVLEFEANGPPLPKNAKAVSIFEIGEHP